MAGRNSLSEADHLRVSEAVHVAESGTAGEIVTIIADRSDQYLDIAVWWPLIVAVLALALAAAVPHVPLGLIDRLAGGWGDEITLAEAMELALAIFVLSFVIVRLAVMWKPLLMAITPRFVRRARVHRRALRYFKVGAERRTTGRTGILIYLSMAEHMAEIIVDEAMHGKVAPETWGEAMAKLVSGARAGRIADGMIAAIGDVGAILAEHLPRADDDANELPDRLIQL